MSSAVNVAIHPSQFPEAVRRDLLHSLRSRQLNHKFLYDSFKQTQKWLALHAAYAPSRTDPDCAAIYDRAFESVAKLMYGESIHLIGLGCGGGQKDARLLHLLRDAGKQSYYTPCDVGVAMVLTAREAALSTIAAENCHPLVCDLATADDLETVLAEHAQPNAARLVTFFGMIPNFEPQFILPRLAALVRPGDRLLFSANLAPGPDYAEGMQRILPLYDNELTRDWLMAFVTDLGVETSDGEIVFTVESDPFGSGLKRIVANFHFHRARQIQLDAEIVDFPAGTAFRLFFSYRHTPDRVRDLLAAHGLSVGEEWVTASQEEGVFLCQKG